MKVLANANPVRRIVFPASVSHSAMSAPIPTISILAMEVVNSVMSQKVTIYYKIIAFIVIQILIFQLLMDHAFTVEFKAVLSVKWVLALPVMKVIFSIMLHATSVRFKGAYNVKILPVFSVMNLNIS